MKLNILSTVSISALALAGALVAPQVFARGPGQHIFEKFDANKDGKVTRTEAHQKVLERFRNVDANHDKVVSQAEARAHHEAKMKKRGNPEAFVEAKFRAHDTNKDGKIARSESKLPDAKFDRIDKNSDGNITKEEALQSFRERRAGHHKRHGDRASSEHRKEDKPHKGHKKGKRGPHRSPFDHIDTSGDGKITEAEAKGAADRVFSRIDQNQDNVITRAEAAQMKKHHSPRSRSKDQNKKKK